MKHYQHAESTDIALFKCCKEPPVKLGADTVYAQYKEDTAVGRQASTLKSGLQQLAEVGYMFLRKPSNRNNVHW